MAKSSNNYSILVGVQLETSNIQSQLNKIAKSLKFDLNFDTGDGLSKSLGNVSTTVKEVGKSAETASKQTDALGDSMKNTGNSTYDAMLTFQAANEVFQTSIEIIGSMVEQVFELNDAMIEFQKVSSLSGEALEDYVAELSDIGNTVGRTGSEMVEAATEFRKNGFGDEDAAGLAELAAMFQNVADEEVNAGEAASFMIAQMVAFGIEAEDASKIIDSVNEVSNNYSVSSGDLANSLGLVSATAGAMGNSMEETLGMMTAITEQTRSANKAARGLNSIFTELSSVLDDASSNGKKITAIFNELNIDIFDEQTGQMRDSYDLLKDLAAEWKTLESNEQDYIAQTIASKTQMNNFLALMNNFDHAISATETAYNSAGSASRENEKYMESLNAKLSQLKNTFQDLSNNVIQSDMVGGLLDLANGFLSLVNTPVGAWATQVVLLTTAGWGFVKLMQAMGIVKVVVANFQALPLALQAITSAMKGTAAATVATSAAMKASLPIFGAIVAAVTAGVAIFDALTTSLEEQKEIVEGLKGEINTLTSEYDALKEQTDLTEADETRLKILEKQIEANKILLRQEAEKQYYMQFGKGSTVQEGTAGSSGYTSGSSSFTGGIAYGAAQQGTVDVAPSVTTGIERFEESIQTFNKLQESIKTVEEAMANLDTSTVEGAKEMASLQEQYDKLTSQSKNLYESINTTAEELVSMGESMGDNEDPIKNLDEGAQKAYASYEDMLDAFVATDGEIDDLNNSQETLSGSIQTLSESASEAVSELGSLDDKYSTLTSAVEEYNSNGSLSADTLAKLLELGDEYISMLSFENGQLVLNGDALNNKAEQLRQTAIEEAKASAAAQLHSIAINGVSDSTVNANNTAAGATGGLQMYADALDQVASGALTAAGAVGTFKNIVNEEGGAVTLSSEQKAAMEEVLSNYQSFVNLVNSTNLSGSFVSSGSGSGGGGGSSSASTVDPIEEQSKAFQEQIDILEHELKIMEKMGASEEDRIAKSKEIQEEIKRQEAWYRAQGLDDNSEYLRDLEEQWWDYQESIKDIYKEILENQLEDLQSQQSAYETLFDRIKEVADEQIAALEEQKEAEEEYWDEKIEALEAQNEALEDQIQKEELLDNIAKARQKQVMVYKDGRFQYLGDIDEVSQAQEALEEYEREQALKEQTEALEEEKDKALAALDEQIQGWEEYKNKWSDIVDEIGSIQDVLLIEQELGIKLEGENWQERLTNLGVFSAGYISKEGNFVNESINKNGELLRNQYAQIGEEAAILQQRLNNFDTYINEILGVQQNFVNSQINLAAQSNKAWSDSLNGFNNYVQGYKDLANQLNNIQIKKPGVSGTGSGLPGGLSGGGHSGSVNLPSVYANGTTNARGGISLVGEQGPEMRVLNSGDGILPADITKNLWSWGMTTPSAMLATLAGGFDAFGQKIQIIIEKFAPNLPNVQNGPDFANYLANNFVRSVVQYQGA